MSIENNKHDDIKKEIEEESSEDFIGIIMRQTTLTEEVAQERLNYYNNDYVKVIEEFMGTINKNKLKSEKSITINQQIYKEIRNVMDNASMNFYSKREMNVQQ